MKYDATARSVMEWANSELEHVGRIVACSNPKIQYSYALSTVNGMAHLKDALSELINDKAYNYMKEDLVKTHNSVIRVMKHLIKDFNVNLNITNKELLPIDSLIVLDKVKPKIFFIKKYGLAKYILKVCVYKIISIIAIKIKVDAIKLITVNFKVALIAFSERRFQANKTKKHKACNSKAKNKIIQLFADKDKNIAKVAKEINKGYS
jgi:hypothetical protein